MCTCGGQKKSLVAISQVSPISSICFQTISLPSLGLAEQRRTCQKISGTFLSLPMCLGLQAHATTTVLFISRWTSALHTCKIADTLSSESCPLPGLPVDLFSSMTPCQVAKPSPATRKEGIKKKSMTNFHNPKNRFMQYNQVLCLCLSLSPIHSFKIAELPFTGKGTIKIPGSLKLYFHFCQATW